MALDIQSAATLQDFYAFTAQPEYDKKRFEFIYGEIIEVPPPSPLHAYIAGMIYAAILRYLEDHDIGFAFPDSVGYTLNNSAEVIPDASFIAYERQATLPDKFSVAPNLAVEVVSPSNRPRQMLDKVELYLASGVELVWLVYPTEQVVDVYRSGEDEAIVLHKLEQDDHFDGENILPGFKLAVKSVFPKQALR